jgi:nicotinamide-nucleotide amidase
VRCEVLAVGTELLLGQIVDTNSAWLGEHLALIGVDCHYQTKVGDNLGRIVSSLRLALDRSDAVIVSGGLGPTQDDITREAIAEVMGVGLVRDEAVLERIRAMFSSRGRTMAENNARQADVPVGAAVIEQRRGTAPGLVCPVGDKVVYAVPGVPYEMEEMFERAIAPDLQDRMGERATIVSRVLRTWGDAESTLAERVAHRLDALDGTGNPTLAFLASGIEGIKIRITAKAADAEAAWKLVDTEEDELRAVLGPLVFGVDDETMEHAVLDLLRRRGMTLAVAESVTGGIVGSRLTTPAGASEVFRGGLVAYASDLKFRLLGVPEGPVVSEEAAAAMATGVRALLGADVGLAVTGVAGPTEQDGQPVGTVIFALDVAGAVETHRTRLPGDRDRVRQFACISLLNLLRIRLLEAAGLAP